MARPACLKGQGEPHFLKPGPSRVVSRILPVWPQNFETAEQQHYRLVVGMAGAAVRPGSANVGRIVSPEPAPNQGDNCARLPQTVKMPESEAPFGAAEAVGVRSPERCRCYACPQYNQDSSLQTRSAFAVESRADFAGIRASAMFNIFSVHIISLLIAGLSVVSVFVYIPLVSDYAFWVLVAAYVMVAGHR